MMKRNTMLTGVIGGTSVALLLSAGIALADDDRSRGRDDDMRGDHWMSLTELTQQLETRGYTPYEIEIDDGAYQVHMADAEGMRIQVSLDPITGEPLRGSLPSDDDDPR